MPLQSSCADLWLKSHPLSNVLSIVMALGQWCPYRVRKELHCQKWRPYMTRRPFLCPFVQRRREMACTVPNPGLSIAEPRGSHAVCTLRVSEPFRCTHPSPPVPPFLLAQNQSLKKCCTKWHHKMKVVGCIYVSTTYNYVYMINYNPFSYPLTIIYLSGDLISSYDVTSSNCPWKKVLCE